NRDIARKFGIRDSVVQNRIERLSRWAQGFHNLMLKQLPLDESLAADGFESFSYSQYYPNNINIIAGRDSQFLYSTGLSILRRKGKMTNAQKKRRAELEQQGKASSSMTYSSMKNLGDGLANLLINKEIGNALLWTDEHRSYSGAFRSQGVFQHLRVSSKKARTFKNPLFAVNYLDRQFRKDLSDHTRETVQFAHHPACMMNRLILYRHFHNYIKPYRIKEQKENRMPKSTHGEEAGLDKDYLLEMKTQLEGKRFFYSKLDLDREEMQTWMQGWKNPGLNSTRYVPKYITV
ncbi:MAG: hypothetical protein PQJ50_00365, partial [Spirochaetales bacterium]|nr:hypothetical protein [Spirochaetales bacterium]